MKKIIKIIPLVLLVLIQKNSYGQVFSSIKGEVKYRNGQKLQSATVLLLKLTDSSLVKSAITDAEGVFTLNGLLPGSYFLKITNTATQPYTSKEIRLTGSGDVYEAGIIYAEEYVKGLQDVQVATKKPFIELEADKMVINIEGSSINAGANVMEVLEKAPGLAVDELSGRININGKQGTLVMINGRPVYLSAADLANLLKSTPSSQLEKIEIITNPSSKYDAAGNAGIINLKLKKSQREGFNGSYTATLMQGVYFKASNNISVNYRSGKWNLYGNYSIQRRNDFTRIDFTRVFPGANPLITSVQNSFRKFIVTPQNYNAGIDYTLNKATTFGLMVKGTATHFRSPQENKNEFFKENGTRESFANTTAFTKEKSSNFSTNFNFRKIFDSIGKELSIDIDYSKFSKHNTQNFTTLFYDENGAQQIFPYIQDGVTPSSVNIKAIRTDYIHPLSRKRKIETGLKVSKVITDNFPRFEKTVNGIKYPDSSQTNHFIYEETISAAYINFSKEFKAISLQAGLRAENTLGFGNQKITGETFRRNYLQLFPTFFLQHKISANHKVTFAYGRRIDRPGYQDLNPFSLFLDQYSLWRGNPILGPQFTNNAELSHQFKNTVITKLNYTRSDDVITDVLKQIDTSKISIQTKDNINTFINTGIAITTTLNPAKWWSGNISFNVYRNEYKGRFLNEPFTKSLIALSATISNSFIISSRISADINGFYQSKVLTGFEESISKSSVSIGLRRISKDRRTTIQLNVSDIFLDQRGGGLTRIANLNTTSLVRYDSRVVRLGFTYRFGKSSVPAARRRETSVEDEKGRVSN